MESTQVERYRASALALLAEASADVQDGTTHAIAVVQLHVDEEGEVATRYRASMGPRVLPVTMLEEVRRVTAEDIREDEIRLVNPIC